MKRRTLLGFPALILCSGRARALVLHGSAIDLEVDEGFDPGTLALLEPWIVKSADAVVTYYGKFPVPRLTLQLRSSPGAGVSGGQAFPGDPPTIRARVGKRSTEKHLMTDDWVMVHEMVHIAFPWLGLKHNWMAEGLAVYVESIARVQAGHIPAEQIWRDFMVSMPRGLPRPSEGGLEQSQSWGRTYWGGAMFCLFADLQIREETDGRHALQTALRAINAELDFRRSHDFRSTLAMGDAATGRNVLTTLYEKWGFSPVSPDLDALWADLGVSMNGGAVSFDGNAPRAKWRLALTARTTPSPTPSISPSGTRHR